MKAEMTAISELAKRCWISKETERYLTAQQVRTVSDLGYCDPYDLKWLRMPDINMTISNDILSVFARLDEETACNDDRCRSLLYDRLPVDLQERLELYFSVHCSHVMAVENYVLRTGLTVEQLHNEAVTGVYGLMRLVTGFGLAENVVFRRFILDYLDDEIFAMRSDIYAKVRELYALRRAVLETPETTLRWDEIGAFFLLPSLRVEFNKALTCYPKEDYIVQRFNLNADDVIPLFKKPMAVFDERFGDALSDKEKLEAISLLDVIQGDFADILNEYVEKQLYGESCD